jgi:DNA-binding MarR family transcriptional regulator
MDIGIEEILGCACLRMRRATRRMTQVYDHALSPAGVTINQFGLLAQLYGASLAGLAGFSINVLAMRLGADPTTLNRTLKPLQEKGLVRDAVDPSDGRVRLVQLTDKGRREFTKVVAPRWREAQAQVEKALGQKSMRALNDLLDLSTAKLESLS